MRIMKLLFHNSQLLYLLLQMKVMELVRAFASFIYYIMFFVIFVASIFFIAFSSLIFQGIVPVVNKAVACNNEINSGSQTTMTKCLQVDKAIENELQNLKDTSERILGIKFNEIFNNDIMSGIPLGITKIIENTSGIHEELTSLNAGLVDTNQNLTGINNNLTDLNEDVDYIRTRVDSPSY
jgi:hypothetical protein